VLVLTKRLGTGIITTALKHGITEDAHVQAAVASMKTLNRQAAEAARLAHGRAVTDITGFGLLGHAYEMAQLGRVDFRFSFDQLPWLPGAMVYGEEGTFPGGMGRNMDYFAPWVTFADGISPLMQCMLWTPETSGGLLVALAPAAAARVPGVQVGRLLEGEPGRIVVRSAAIPSSGR
jgi:selenide,water dikinase